MNFQEYITKKYGTTDIDSLIESCKKYMNFESYKLTEDSLMFNDVTICKDIPVTSTGKTLKEGDKLKALDFTNIGWMKIYEDNTESASYIVIGNPIIEGILQESPDATSAYNAILPHVVDCINIVRSMTVEQLAVLKGKIQDDSAESSIIDTILYQATRTQPYTNNI